ncbi:response regulator transcription factor [Pseudochelatococcus contaminans]|uniref:DNA-binding response OmpR family regulator n=1 Tax=Pseudochelatococcus contaminans TaxID=1538103 RepID=A0A7W5Z4W8_9HYPH|nr:response regulator [Pseudochelatococcus contaminans]MBB3809611.1 DNA-binding response OmpR family regulator [Pseudochelatococcus contaminans]
MTATVLIADDEPNIVLALEFMLKREGHRVLVARDGAETMQRIRQENPAVVLLDATMPGLSGFDICEAVRADPALAGTRILMLTAKGRETDKARGLGAGADLYITKPFATSELLGKIREMLA